MRKFIGDVELSAPDNGGYVFANFGDGRGQEQVFRPCIGKRGIDGHARSIYVYSRDDFERECHKLAERWGMTS